MATTKKFRPTSTEQLGTADPSPAPAAPVPAATKPPQTAPGTPGAAQPVQAAPKAAKPAGATPGGPQTGPAKQAPRESAVSPSPAPTQAQQQAPGGKHRSLSHAKLAVMQEVNYVQKTKGKGLAYTYASEEHIVLALHEACLEAGLTITPVGVEILQHGTFTTKSGTLMNHVIVRNTYRLTHAASGQTEEGQMVGEAMDAGDKCTNKAMTGAFKYFLRQTFLIPTGDDPDQASSEPMERGAPAKGNGRAAVPAQQQDDSFTRCMDALRNAPNVPLLDKYRGIYTSGRNYTPQQVKALDEVYHSRKNKLQADTLRPAGVVPPQEDPPPAPAEDEAVDGDGEDGDGTYDEEGGEDGDEG